ncbi:unnamed protein product [Clonostachys chloroleuca]|uniref:Alpha-L-fucosidase n=1 Tax=Clonostachys chloroleuca TaxID=1926264 RepID=A0AA35M4U1_9HYPO|nr:unnamed protein product [Clonostachys chloroleuca]
MRLYRLVVICFAIIDNVTGASEASYKLYYNASAVRDFFDALPLGNGRLGAVVHGYVDKELIRLNEESIWSGGPMDKVPPTAKGNLETLRQQILNGSLTEAGETWSQHFVPEYDDMRRYQPAGELRIDFPHDQADVSEYRRELDISNGVVSVSYNHGNITYSRESIANYPHNVLAFKISADQPGSLRLSLGLSRSLNATRVSAELSPRQLTLHGTGQEDDSYRFASKARIALANDAGTVSSNGTAIEITEADEVWIFYSAETAYHHPDATYDDLDRIVAERLEEASRLGYEALRSESIEDYQSYYNRSSIDLGTSDEIGLKTVPERRENWKRGGNVANDIEFMSLQFNYGKYLLIQSSRPGSLPANLQGIWNQAFNPAWDSKFTLNINLQMNYWLAQPLDLPEIAEPIVDFLDKLSVVGRDVATRMYGADGWCAHHNTDITFDATPYHGLTIAAPYPLGGAWVAFEAIEHFRFTRDKTFAKERTLPILKGAMDFIYSWATERDGHWITNPSCSPENSYYIPEGMTVAGENTGIDAGAMNDRAIMWEVMQGFIEISEALGLDEGVQRAKGFRDGIEGPVAGSFGQLLEYSREFRENQPGHRHFSPLVGAHPGTWTTRLTTPEDADKAYTLLRWRMDNGGGGNSWAVTWASVLHARLFDSAHALQYLVELQDRWVHENLFSRNGGYFQIDGNSGYTASVVEMFLQSHAGVIHLGPAIPEAGQGLSSGSFKGWIGRGGFKIDMEWKDGKVCGASITSLKGSPLKIRIGNGVPYKINGREYRGLDEEAFGTQAGEMYTITV